ncbi:MAG TPA: ion channel [Candidatus Binatia bacterium]|jgi:voltage-gated potassium channel Kch
MSKVIDRRAEILHPLGGGYLSRRYTILFYTLLATMVAAPVLTALELSGALIDLLLAASLIAAVMPVRSGASRWTLLILTVVSWLAREVTAWFQHPALSAVTLGLWIAIALFAAAAALRFAMSGDSIDAEHLYAALSAYMLAGIFFGVFYWAIEQLGPGNFSAGTEFSRMSALYFSFITLATLGYGDIVPRSDVARGLAIVEAVGGQLFLAVLVARLVALYGRSSTTHE